MQAQHRRRAWWWVVLLGLGALCVVLILQTWPGLTGVEPVHVPDRTPDGLTAGGHATASEPPSRPATSDGDLRTPAIPAVRAVERIGNASISGRVTSFDGVLPARGARVIAVPAASNLAALTTLDALLASEAVTATDVSPDGAYALHGLQAAALYDVYAVARGYLPTGYRPKVRAPQSGADLQCARLFGVFVTYRGRDGAPLLVGRSVFGTDNPWWRCKSWHARDVPALGGRMELLTGLEFPHGAGGSQFDRVVLCTTPEAASTAGVLEIGGRIPGYSSIESQVELLPLDEVREIPEHRIVLSQEAQGFGSLSMSFIGEARRFLTTPAGATPVAIAYLTPADVEAGVELAVINDTEKELLVSGIPFGIYDFQLICRGLPFRWPVEGNRVTLTIGAAVERVVVDCSGMCAVRLDVPDARWTGGGADLQVSLRRREESVAGVVLCRKERDYVLAGLTAGEYQFTVPGVRGDLVSEWITLLPGQLQSVSIR